MQQPLPPPTKMKKEKSYTMQTQINLVVVGQSQQYHAMLKAGMWYAEESQGGQILCQAAFDISCWCDFTRYFL